MRARQVATAFHARLWGGGEGLVPLARLRWPGAATRSVSTPSIMMSPGLPAGGRGGKKGGGGGGVAEGEACRAPSAGPRARLERALSPDTSMRVHTKHGLARWTRIHENACARTSICPRTVVLAWCVWCCGCEHVYMPCVCMPSWGGYVDMQVVCIYVAYMHACIMYVAKYEQTHARARTGQTHVRARHARPHKRRCKRGAGDDGPPRPGLAPTQGAPPPGNAC